MWLMIRDMILKFEVDTFKTKEVILKKNAFLSKKNLNSWRDNS
jgi:hypothetical protein